MISSRKVVFFCLCLLISSVVFSDAFGGLFGGSRRRNMALEALLATGILTLLLNHHGGKGGGGGGYSQSFSGPSYGHFMNYGHGFGNLHNMAPLTHLPILPNAGHFPGHGLGADVFNQEQFNELFPELKEHIGNRPSKQGKSLPEFPPFPGHPQNLPPPAQLANIPVDSEPMNPPLPAYPGKVFPEGQHALGYRSQGEAQKPSWQPSQIDPNNGYSDSSMPGNYNGFGGTGNPNPPSNDHHTAPNNYNSPPESYFYDYRSSGEPVRPSESPSH